MLSVIATGGKQYVVKTGQVLKVEKLVVEEGAIFVFDKVLLTANDDGSDVEMGTPFLQDTTIKAKVLKQGRAERILVEKFKNKTRQNKALGHRQRYTEVEIQ